MNNICTRHDINKPAKSIEVKSVYADYYVDIGGYINDYLSSLSDRDTVLSIDYKIVDNSKHIVAIITVLKGDSHEDV